MGLNPIEMRWHDLNLVVLDVFLDVFLGVMLKPSNVAELKQFCTEEWAKIPPQRCERLIASYRKRMIAVVAGKGGSSY